MGTLRTSGSAASRRPAEPLRALAYVGCSDSIAQDVGRLVWVGDAHEITIGRGDSFSARGASRRLDLAAPDVRLSSHHARILRERDYFVFIDQGSTNGSYVNGRRAERQVLRAGDVLRTGHTFWRFIEFVPRDGAPLPGETSGMVGPTRTICPTLVEQMRLLKRVARGRLPLLILGETGAGKEVVARQAHEWSGRKGEFRALHCAAIPGSLLEGELFGHKRGAFTGATEDRPGLIEVAEGGTLLLDEVGDLPEEAQVKLLRVLQDGQVTRLGENRLRKVDVRCVAATHRDLPEMIRAGRFRKDLHARLAGYTVSLPPLRDRIEDMGILLSHFLATFAGADAGAVRFDCAVFERLLGHGWAYNVRELERTLESVLLLAREAPEVRVDHLDPALVTGGPAERPTSSGPPSEDALKARIEALLVEHGGNVSAIARALGKSRTQVHRWLKRFALERRASPARR